MGLYVVTLPEGAYTTLQGSISRIVAADNSTDAIAIAARFTASDGAPWYSATATLLTGSADFSRYTFGFTITHDSDNGMTSDAVVEYTPLPGDTIDEIGAGLVAAAIAANADLSGTTYASHIVIIASGANCGKSVITAHPVVYQGEPVATDVPGGNSTALGGNDFPDYALTGTSILPTIDAASGSTVALARHFTLVPLTTGINPECFGQLVGGY